MHYLIWINWSTLFKIHTDTHTHLPTFTANRGHMIFHCKTEDLYIQTFHNETVDFCVKTWHLTATTRTLTYYRQWGTYPPYASLSCIALSASFKKPRTSSVLYVSSFPRWNVKCVSSFVGENKRTPTHTQTYPPYNRCWIYLRSVQSEFNVDNPNGEILEIHSPLLKFYKTSSTGFQTKLSIYDGVDDVKGHGGHLALTLYQKSTVLSCPNWEWKWILDRQDHKILKFYISYWNLFYW